MDGVLVDSELVHFEATSQMLNELFQIEIEYDYYKQYIGGTVENLWKGIISDFNIGGENVTSINLKADKYLEEMISESGYPEVSGVVRFVKYLHEKTDLMLAVASSSSMEKIKRNIKKMGLEDCFHILVSGADIGKSKPAPDVFLMAADKLGIDCHECMVIEDSENGVMAAANAKMPCLGFINPHSGDQNLSRASALFEDFDNLDLNYIKLIYGHSVGEPVTVITTDRLIIREICEKDVDKLYEIYKDKEVTKYMPDLFANIEDELEYTRQYIKKVYHFYLYGMWIVELKSTGEIIGRAGIDVIEKDGDIACELGYLIAKQYQGLGYATEATLAVIEYARKYLDVEKLFVEIDRENIPSMKIARKIGVNFTGKKNQKGYEEGWLTLN